MVNKDLKDHPDLMERVGQREKRENQDPTEFQDPQDALVQTDQTD